MFEARRRAGNLCPIETSRLTGAGARVEIAAGVRNLCRTQNREGVGGGAWANLKGHIFEARGSAGNLCPIKVVRLVGWASSGRDLCRTKPPTWALIEPGPTRKGRDGASRRGYLLNQGATSARWSPGELERAHSRSAWGAGNLCPIKGARLVGWANSGRDLCRTKYPDVAGGGASPA